MTDISSLRKKQIEFGQLPSSTIPIPSIEKSPEEYKDDINANRNSITDGLVKIGFTYDFIRDLLGDLTNEQIYLASLYLPQIIENFNRYDKKFVSVEQAISIIKTIIKNNKTNRRSVFRSNSTQIKPTEPVYSPPLLEKDKIILESAICLAKWEHNISGINNQVYPRPKELPPYYNTSIQRNKEHPLNGYSDDTIDQIRKQPYALENFTYLLSLSKLPQNRLEDTYNKTLQLRTALSNFSGDFSISQAETIKNILKENGRRMRDAQDAYINSINSAASGIVFNLDDVGNNIFSSPSGWGFKSFGQQTESNQDMPYGNWHENIADLVLDRIDCFVDFFKKLDPTLQSGLRLGGKNNKKVKRKTNKKRKYKKIKTTKRRK
jgi:hypothetical protein